MMHTDVINLLWEVLNKSLLIYLEGESTESTKWSCSTFSTCTPISKRHTSYRSQKQQQIKATWGEMVSHLWNRLKDPNCREETKKICDHFYNMTSPTLHETQLLLLPNKNHINLQPVGKSQILLRMSPIFLLHETHTRGKWDHFTSYPDATVSIWSNISSQPFSTLLRRDFMTLLPLFELKRMVIPTGQTEGIRPGCNTAKKTPNKFKNV